MREAGADWNKNYYRFRGDPRSDSGVRDEGGKKSKTIEKRRYRSGAKGWRDREGFSIWS